MINHINFIIRRCRDRGLKSSTYNQSLVQRGAVNVYHTSDIQLFDTMHAIAERGCTSSLFRILFIYLKQISHVNSVYWVGLYAQRQAIPLFENQIHMGNLQLFI